VAESRAGESRNTDTRERILDAAERLFLEHGFDGTSSRMITAEADANLAAVNYHFGGKEGLFQAGFETMAAQIGNHIEPFVGAIEAHLSTAPKGRKMRSQSLELVLHLLEGLAGLITDEASAPWGQLIVRE